MLILCVGADDMQAGKGQHARRCATALLQQVPFKLDGPNGLLAYLDNVIKYKGHCVLCVAEGAGQVRGRGFKNAVARCLELGNQQAKLFH